jgi:hypothetical protein
MCCLDRSFLGAAVTGRQHSLLNLAAAFGYRMFCMPAWSICRWPLFGDYAFPGIRILTDVLLGLPAAASKALQLCTKSDIQGLC